MNILVVGGTVMQVFDKDTGRAYRGLFERKATGLGGFLTLPSQGVYRIKASKLRGIPGMKVFITIPNPDGTIEKITYNNITANEKSTGTIEFFVGRGNKNKSMRINLASHGAQPRDMLPTYQAVLPTILPPPRNLELIHQNNAVHLGWENPTHPRFQGVLVLRKERSHPNTSDDGVVIYQGAGTSAADATIEKDKLYCYAAYSRDEPQAASISTHECIHTGYYAISGKVLGCGKDTTITLIAAGRILGHRKAGEDGAYRVNNLRRGNYLIKVQLDSASKSSDAGTVTVNDKDVKAIVDCRRVRQRGRRGCSVK